VIYDLETSQSLVMFSSQVDSGKFSWVTLKFLWKDYRASFHVDYELKVDK
jgi:hypothetical protein